MSERGFTGVFIVALLVAAAATYAVHRFVTQRDALARGRDVTTVPVVIAAQDITEGSALTKEILRIKEYNSDAVPHGAFQAIDSLGGRVARIPIFDGEPVLEAKLAQVGASAGLEVKIQPGFRAMSIPVNDHVGISGMIQPNSRVDVLVTLRPDANRAERTAKVFLQNMRVLSVGTQIRRGDDGKPITANTVTLEVKPDEAEMLALAMNEGVLQLALRGFADTDSLQTGGATPKKVLAAAAAIERRARRAPQRQAPVIRKASPPPEPQYAVVDTPTWMKVQIYRGVELTEQKVETNDSTAKRDTVRAGSPRSE